MKSHRNRLSIKMIRVSPTSFALMCLLAIFLWNQSPRNIFTSGPLSSFTNTASTGTSASNFLVDDSPTTQKFLRDAKDYENNGNEFQSTLLSSSPATSSFSYEASFLERYVLEHASDLHYQGTRRADLAPGCEIWKNETVSTPEIYKALNQFRQQLKDYHVKLHAAFNGTSKIRDLRTEMTLRDKSICDLLELHPNGLSELFPHNTLSNMPGSMGYMEPLLTPLRHPNYCFQRKHVLNMDYMVHDFASMCRNALHPDSRTIFVDMGASLDFHGKGRTSPAVYITQLYQQFGFRFDHIYAYEVTPKNSTTVYQQIPNDLKAAYHWYNVGVDASITSNNNPLKLLLENYNPNDFIVVKLDIDTSFIEVPMAKYLANDDRLHQLIDAFYFEHHVFLKEMAHYWGKSMKGSVQESLALFSTLRQKGIAAHYWP